MCAMMLKLRMFFMDYSFRNGGSFSKRSLRNREASRRSQTNPL
jgi:hypothetical protein